MEKPRSNLTAGTLMINLNSRGAQGVLEVYLKIEIAFLILELIIKLSTVQPAATRSWKPSEL